MEVLAAKAFGFALKHWTWFAIAGLVIALKLQGGALDHRTTQWAAERTAAQANLATAKSYRELIFGKTGWKAAYASVEAERDKESRKAADAVTAASLGRAAASSDAFDQGYAAGRAVGRKTCGAANAADPISLPALAGRSVPDRDRLRLDDADDFARSWSRDAYVPQGPVPAVH